VTSSESAAAKIKSLALHGMTQDAWRRFSDDGYKHYLVTAAGFKYNMMDLQAAIGLHQLRRVEQTWTKRQHIWERYMEELADLPLTLPSPVEPETRHAYHLFTILIDPDAGVTRDEFLEEMTRLGIGVGVHYLSLAEHPYYRTRFGWRPEDTPVATRIGRQTVSLPLGPQLTMQDIADVVTAVRRALPVATPSR